jgi:type IV secretion system protein VirB1
VLPGMELMSCPNLAVPREVMHHVVRVESSYNPYAIGVVRGRLVRQPRSLSEAVSTARMLEQRGYNFSLGLAQVNRYNLSKYGLTSYEQAFQPCANLVAGSRILRECYGRSGGDWGKSFSCYYSGDFRTGYRHGYVQKVFASMRRGGSMPATLEAPIAVIDRAQRRVVAAEPRSPMPQMRANALAALMERRTGSAAAATVQAALPAPTQSALADSRTDVLDAPANIPARVVAQPEQPAAPDQSAQPQPARPVVVTASRPGGAPNPLPQGVPQAGGADGAFVF